MKSTIAALAVITVTLTACDREQTQLRNENRTLREQVHQLESEIANIPQKRVELTAIQREGNNADRAERKKDLPPPNGKQQTVEQNQILKLKVQELKSDIANGGLNRETAFTILSDFLFKPSITEISFFPGGVNQATADGILTEAGGFPPTLSFTQKGLDVFGDLVDRSNNRVVLAPLGMENPKFTLPSPIAEMVLSVDGIADGTLSQSGMKEVSFTTRYIFPSNTKGNLKAYIFAGRKAKLLLRRYDDGWRVEQ
jgi:hypothetical protein